LREALRTLLGAMLDRSRAEGSVTLDALGDALFEVSASVEEIDDFLGRFEGSGGVIDAPSGGGTSERLRVVLVEVRAFYTKEGRRPTLAELAERTGLPEEQIRHALALGRVMGR
jgi:hypothetical protein